MTTPVHPIEPWLEADETIINHDGARVILKIAVQPTPDAAGQRRQDYGGRATQPRG